MNVKGIAIVCLSSLLMACCSSPSPQRPSQRKSEAPQADSAHLALLQLNKELAEAADRELMQLAQAQDPPYALYEGNAWGVILERGDTGLPSPKANEEWSVHMRVMSLDQQLLSDSEGTYRIGKYELPPAIDANITEWHHGTRARMFVPWYTAFGMQGTEHIPAYENVIIEIEVK